MASDTCSVVDARQVLEAALAAGINDPTHNPTGTAVPFAVWVVANHRTIDRTSSVDDATAERLIRSMDLDTLAKHLRDTIAGDVVAGMRRAGPVKLDAWLDKRLGQGGFERLTALCAQPDWSTIGGLLGDADLPYGLVRLAWVGFQVAYRRLAADLKRATEGDRLLGVVGQAVNATKRAEIANRYLALDDAGLRRTPTTPLSQRALAVGVLGPEAFALDMPEKGKHGRAKLVKSHPRDDHVVEYLGPEDIKPDPKLDPDPRMTAEQAAAARRAQLDDLRLRIYRRLAGVLGKRYAYDLLEAVMTVLLRKIAERWAVQAPGSDPAYQVSHRVAWEEIDAVGKFSERIRSSGGRTEAIYAFRRHLCLYLATLGSTAVTDVADSTARSLLTVDEIRKCPPPPMVGRWTKHKIAVDGLFEHALLGIGSAFWQPLFGDCKSVLYSISRPSRIFAAGGIPVGRYALRMRGQALLDLIISRSNACHIVTVRKRAMGAETPHPEPGVPAWVTDPKERTVAITDDDFAHLIGLRFGSYADALSGTERGRERDQLRFILRSLHQTDEIHDFHFYADASANGVRAVVLLGNGSLRDHVRGIEILPSQPK